VKLLLAGRICEHVADASNVRKLGRLDCILDAYDMADIVINPVQYGSGLNIKTIEALGYGMPVVSTTAGARGLELATGQQALLVAADDDDFGKRVLEVFAAPTVALKLSANAVRFAAHWNQLQIDMLLHHLEQPKQPRREWVKG
jgi:glycosyltransferase involved in cell wall biosynthesis